MQNPETLAAVKRDLETQREELVRKIASLARTPDFGSDTEDEDEEASETEETGTNLAMRETLKLRLEEVEKALAKIEKGAYGACESCGNPIEPDLLRIAPESLLCRACKQKRL